VLHVQLLGDFRLVHNGFPITSVRSQRQQSLLAYLAMHGGAPQSRQQLAFLFWPDSSETQARTNLRNLLHQLRRDLPEAERLLCISTRNVEWRSETGSTLDVAAFECALRRAEEAGDDERRIQAALKEAVDCYTGDLLPALYDDWILSVRERLRGLFLQALDRLIVLLESQRDYARAIAYAVQLLQHDPLHEATYRRLMRLHALNHDRTAALRVYATCAQLLQRELDVAPEPATVELYQQLLQEQEGSERVAESAESSLQQPVALTPLVGRQFAWQQMMESWQRAARGEPHLLLISGEAGIGKTRLTEELVQWTTRQGIATAVAHCYAVEESLSYGPVISWLRSDPLQRTLPELDQIWRVELARLLPEVHLRQPSLPQPEPLTQGWQRQRLFEAVTRAVMAARQPLLLVLEDLHWCDAETLAWVHYLLRSCGPARLLVVATLRIEEIQAVHALVDWQQSLQRMGMLREIPLGPLNRAETAQLAALVADQPLDPAVNDRLYRQTEGHPLFVVEMTRAGTDPAHPPPASQDSADGLATPLPAAPLPAGMRSVIETRLNQLSPSSRDLINLAAVIGRQFTLEVLVTASSADALTLADGLDEALRHRIIREQGSDSYDFSHDRIREMAYATLSHVRRRLLHRQVAEALEAVFTGRSDDVCGQLALHSERAGLAEQAIGYYRQAAEAALRLYAHEDAIHVLSRGLQVLNTLSATSERDEQELELQLMLGSALTITRGYAASEVGEVYRRARALAERVEDRTQQFSALWGLRMFYANAGQVNVGVEVGRQLLDLAMTAEDQELQLHARRALGGALFHQGELILARNTFEQAVVLHDSRRHHTHHLYYDLDPCVSCLAMLTPILWMLGYPDQALARCRQALALMDELAHPASSAFGLNYISWFHLIRGDWENGLTCAEAALSLCDKHGFTQLLGGAMTLKGWALVDGRLIREGIPVMEQGIQTWQTTGARTDMPFFLYALARAYTKAGELENALDLLDEALAEMEERNERQFKPELHRLRGTLLQILGVADADVEACYLSALDCSHKQQAKMLELQAAMSLSRFWHAQGRSAEARRLLADIYDWFTEGFDTFNLKNARTLLNMVS
jgi:predicted ATPase/DNA-binding SARP family transcriptional activator